MPIIDLPADGEEGWGAKLRIAIGAVNTTADEAKTGVTETESSLETHVASETPHPQYDDLPSLALTFENGLI